MIVVDTHAWFWWVTDDRRLSATARGRLNREREVVVPAFCLWEIAMLAQRGRIDIGPDVQAFLRDALDWEGVRLEPLSPEVCVASAGLATQFPLDPGDQLIAGTAIVLRAPLVSRDERLSRLPGLVTVW